MGSTLPACTIALIGLVWLAAPALAEASREAGLDALRDDWHACVREAYANQPSGIEKQAAQRVALARCKVAEKAVVAAELKTQREAEEARRNGSLTTRARAWATSVAGSIVDPVLSWIGR